MMFGFLRTKIHEGSKRGLKQLVSFERERAKPVLSKKPSRYRRATRSSKSPPINPDLSKKTSRDGKSHDSLQSKKEPGISSANADKLPLSSRTEPESSSSWRKSFENSTTDVPFESSATDVPFENSTTDVPFENSTTIVPFQSTLSSGFESDAGISVPFRIKREHSAELLNNNQELKSKWRPWAGKKRTKATAKTIDKGKAKLADKCKVPELDALESSRRALENLKLRQSAERLYASQVYELPTECPRRARQVPPPPLVYRPSSGTPYNNRGLFYTSSVMHRINVLQANNGVPPSPSSKKIYNQEEALCTAAAKLQTIVVRNILSQTLSKITQVAQDSGSSRGSSGSRGHKGASFNGEGRRSGRPGKDLSNKRSRYARRSGQDEDDTSGNSDDERRKKGKWKVGADDGAPRRRLKCPYYQWRPEEYPLASCRGQGFADMAKLKDHLKRVHTQPLRCTRCWQEVWVYDEHFRQDVVCEKRPEPDDRRISPQKFLELSFNRSPFTKSMTVEEKWSTLYRILFPDEKNVPSPYEQYGLSAQFEKLLILALEEEILKELGDVLGNIIDIVRERLPVIVSQCKERVISLSREPMETLSGRHIAATSSNSGSESIFDKPEPPQPAGIGPSMEMDDSNGHLSAIQLGGLPEASKTVGFDGFGVLGDGFQDTFEPWRFEVDYDWESIFHSIEATN